MFLSRPASLFTEAPKDEVRSNRPQLEGHGHHTHMVFLQSEVVLPNIAHSRNKVLLGQKRKLFHVSDVSLRNGSLITNEPNMRHTSSVSSSEFYCV